jgi:transposase-like protein
MAMNPGQQPNTCTRSEGTGIEFGRPEGLLNRLTNSVLETALDAEMTEHLGYGDSPIFMV